MKMFVISASPKLSANSVSRFIAQAAMRRLATNGIETAHVDVRESMQHQAWNQAFENMRQADALLFVFPLYIFCLPGMLMRFLQDYAAGDPGKNQKIYAVVNCGFPDPNINLEALRVIGRFAAHTENSYRFGIALGCGGMLSESKDSPFVRKALASFDQAMDRISADMKKDGCPISKNISIALRFPRFAYVWMGNHHWRQMAKKNGLKKRDLYHTPYAIAHKSILS